MLGIETPAPESSTFGPLALNWVPVKELESSYCKKDTLVCSMYPYDGNLIW